MPLITDITQETRIYFTDKIIARLILPFIPLYVRPNHVTAFRLCATPGVIMLLLMDRIVVGLITFLLVALTDAIDGAMARVRGQITEWGKMYDPAADKFLIAGAFAALAVKNYPFLLTCPGPYTSGDCKNNILLIGLIIILEISIIIAALVRRHRRGAVQANRWGKIKMLFEVASVGLLMIILIFKTAALFGFLSLFLVCTLFFGIISLVTYSN